MPSLLLEDTALVTPFQVNNEEVTTKWKDEVCSNDELDFTPKMADWYIAELRYITTLRIFLGIL